MTKLIIAGDSYELTEAVQLASTGTLKRMKRDSAETGPVVTMDFLEQQIDRLDKLRDDPEFRDIELYGDDAYLQTMTAFVFLCKRFAGEQVTWDQADLYAPAQIVMDSSEDVAPDPKDVAAEAEGATPVE